MNEETVLWYLGSSMTFHARTLVMTWLTMAVVILICLLGVRHLTSGKPGKMQNLLEWLVDFVSKIISDSMDFEKGRSLLAYLSTLILFIFVSNMVGLFPNFTFNLLEHFHIDTAYFNKIFEGANFSSPTADVNTTLALALLTIILVIVMGVRQKGLHYFGHFLQPYKPFVVVHVIDMASKPLSLGFRLFGNIFAGEILIKVIMMIPGIYVLVGILPNLIWLAICIFIGAIQAFVFTVISTAYIAQAVAEEH